MLPHQLRKAVQDANSVAKRQVQENEEQISVEEQSRLRELQMQRHHLEMRKLQAEAGLLTETAAKVAAAGLEWLYEDPKKNKDGGLREREAYLLGKPLPKQPEEAEAPLSDRVANITSLQASKKQITQDTLRKLREDPLFMIKQTEIIQKNNIDSNPLRALESNTGNLGESKRGEKIKKEKKKRKKNLYRDSPERDHAGKADAFNRPTSELSTDFTLGRKYGPIKPIQESSDPFGVPQDLLPPESIRHRANTRTQIHQNISTSLDVTTRPINSGGKMSREEEKRKLIEMIDEGKRHELVKQRRSEIIHIKEVLQHQTEAKWRENKKMKYTSSHGEKVHESQNYSLEHMLRMRKKHRAMDDMLSSIADQK